MRTFARHLGKHLSGNPTIVPQNMAGAGSLRAANFLYNLAPKDGTTIGMFARGLATQPLLDGKGIQYDARKFNWIGSFSSDVSIALSWHSDWIREKKINVMVQLGTKKHPDLGDAPLVMDFAKNASDKRVLELIFSRQEMAYPIVAPPGVPTDRVRMLRQAFDAVVRDPEYLADARRQSLDPIR